jgi:nucleotide-binding universal stress UspA family protein
MEPQKNHPSFAIPPKRIACATDLTPGSRAAEKAAFRLAKMYGVPVTAVWIDPTFVYHAELLASTGGVTSPTFDPEKQKAYLKQRAVQLREHLMPLAKECGVEDFEVFTDSGDPALCLLAWLLSEKRPKADLLVLGQKARGLFQNLILGSTAANVLEESAVPVLVVPEKMKEEHFKFQNIAIATDLSHQNESPTEAAWRLACASGGNVTLLHAFDPQDYRPIPPDTFASEVAYHELAQLFANVSEIKRTHLEKEAEKIRSWQTPEKKSVPCQTVLLHGSPKEAVLSHLKKSHIDALVVGRWSSKGTITSFFLGSTARALAMHTEVPVLVVPHEN